jgi:maltooligosyltrehalose trehalohydrolase
MGGRAHHGGNLNTLDYEPSLGALVGPEGVRFRVWAPAASTVELVLDGQATIALERGEGGYHSLSTTKAGPGSLYRYRIDNGPPLPDPASRYQPEGVHGPSQVVDPAAHEWCHPPRGFDTGAPNAIYELHVGTFTPTGTFRAAADKLPHLAQLGVDTVELMPVADFPGRWNWGYDPGALFATARAYGTPDDLRALVDAAHGLGLRILLDVIYNHLGPDGAYLPAYSPFLFSDRHSTPWGQAIDFDGEHSEGVRRFCLENALMWLREYRLDGLRLDATFAVVDDSPEHLLAQITAAAAQLEGPERLLVAEDPRNQRNVVLPRTLGGLGFGAVWADDFHHQVRKRFAGDDRGYYRDFAGTSSELGRTITGNWYYRGHHSRHHGAPRGTPAADLPPGRFVFCIQNHDQVGNRADGARLNQEIPLHAYRAASALLLFAPQLPLLFMGQEWAADTPFQYFTDHQGELADQVSAGRRREFAEFEFAGDVPDPQDPATFERSRLDWSELEREPHAGIARLYGDLLALRRDLDGPARVVSAPAGGLVLRRSSRLLLVAFEPGVELPLAAGARVVWSSEDERYDQDALPPSATSLGLRFPRSAAVIAEDAG